MEWGKRGPELFAVSDQVPDFALWPKSGISGRIGRGDHLGKPVLARRMDLPSPGAESAYVLWLPEDEMSGPDDDFYIESDTTDSFHTDGTGGLIDYITTGLSIIWSVDPREFEVAERFYPGSDLWEASKSW